MSDHYHYGYASEHHDHHGYADESTVQGLREDLGRAEERIARLEDDLRDALERIRAWEDRMPYYGDEDDQAADEMAHEAMETAMSASERAEYDEISEAYLDAADEARDLAREDGGYDDCEPTL
jgi:hypothetical protein